MSVSFSQNAIAAQPGAQLAFSSLLSVTLSNQPEYLVLSGVDLARNSAASNGTHGTISGNGQTATFSGVNADLSTLSLVFKYTDQGYYNESYGYLSALSFKSPTDTYRNELLSLYGFGAAGTTDPDLQASLSKDFNAAINHSGAYTYKTAAGLSASAMTTYLGTLDIVISPGYTDTTPNQATPNEIATVAASLTGQLWGKVGCWVLANNISAMAGATLPLTSWSVNPFMFPPAGNGEWFVAYNSVTTPKSQQLNWPSLLRPGDVVAAADSCGGHIETIVSGFSYSAQVFDNLYNYSTDVGVDIPLLAPHRLNIVSPFPGDVVIYRLDAPVITVNSPLCLDPNTSKSVFPLFSASDPAGKPIVSYQLYDGNGGSFSVGGLARTAHSAVDAITVDAAALAGTAFVAGSASGSDSIYVRAYNGSYWGDWQSIPVAVGSSLQPPEIHAVSDTIMVHGGQAIDFAALLSVKADAPPATSYTIWDPMDPAFNVGSIQLNGVTDLLHGSGMAATGQTFKVSAADLPKLTYVGGTGFGGEILTVTAQNGAALDGTPISIVMANATPRTVGINHWVTPGTEVPLSSLFFEQVYDSTPIVSYTITADVVVLSWGNNTPSSGGSFELNGATNLWHFDAMPHTIQVSAADLDKVMIRAAPDAGDQMFEIWANNGADGVHGVASLLTISDPPTISAHPVSVEAGKAISASTLFDVNPGITTPAYYRFIDPSGGGSLRLSTDVANLQSLADPTPGVIVINSSDLDKLSYVGGYTVGSEKITMSTSNDNFHWSAEIPATVSSIARLQVAGSNLAFDLDGNAGIAAKLLSVVFGPSSVSNAQYVGACLNYLDGGMSYANLAQIALDAAGATTPEAEAKLLWTNLFGSVPTTAQLAPILDMLNGGTYTPTSLAIAVAESDLNANNIDLVGLHHTGLQYS
ncbi:MAG: hypothetical protein NT159_01875 [Proteobacteria bacterium]|nr:hypothetical protein [Pseudomonadota bacterium]